MEYCNAGSVSDLMEAVGITLDEVCENFLQKSCPINICSAGPETTPGKLLASL
jgi:hypothetical protein